jgi:hypothetical protein
MVNVGDEDVIENVDLWLGRKTNYEECWYRKGRAIAEFRNETPQVGWREEFALVRRYNGLGLHEKDVCFYWSAAKEHVDPICFRSHRRII